MPRKIIRAAGRAHIFTSSGKHGSLHVFTKPGLVPNFYFEQDNRAAFFFGEPIKVFWVIVEWFTSFEIFQHLGVTLLETVLGFVIGAVAGLGIGLWLALSDTSSAVHWTSHKRW